MGLILQNLDTEYGIPIQNAYVGISKTTNGIIVSEDGYGKLEINGYYQIFASKEARQQNKRPLMHQSLFVRVEKEDFGNVFAHLYEVLKQRFPDAQDDL